MSNFNMERFNGLSEEELYAQALLFRDMKVIDCPVEDSESVAQSLFLKLSGLGNRKAMHNYASILYKQGSYEDAFVYFEKAGLEASKKNCASMLKCGQIKQNAVFVIGSHRQSENGSIAAVKTVQGSDSVDLSHHVTSFGGNAITMDLRNASRAQNTKKHIVGDACKFDFSKNCNVTHVLFERFPTVKSSGELLAGTALPVELVSENYLGDAIQNVSKAMKPGAILEIEWEPYVSLHFDTSQLTLLDHLPEMTEKNPFTAFVHRNVPQNAFGQLNGEWHPLPSVIKEVTDAFAEEARAELEFIHSCGVGKSMKQILSYLRQEGFLNKNLTLAGVKNNHIQYCIKGDLCTDSFSECCVDVFKACGPMTVPGVPVGASITMKLPPETEGGEPVYMIGKLFNAQTFLSATLFRYVASTVMAQRNAALVEKYLESVGFHDVVIERRVNEHNKRQNVWMIRAIKT